MELWGFVKSPRGETKGAAPGEEREASWKLEGLRWPSAWQRPAGEAVMAKLLEGRRSKGMKGWWAFSASWAEN
jgi:hypothetical protein